jgi:ATP-binding cassette subfamily B protein
VSFALEATRIPLRRYGRLLARYLRPHRAAMVGLGAILLGGVLFRLAAPLVAAEFVTRAVRGDTTLRSLIWLALAVCAVGLLDQACVVAGTHLGAHLSWGATNRLREDMVGHALRLDLDFHSEHGSGEMIERVDGDARELNNFFSAFAVRLLVNLLLIVGVLVVMTWIDWRIGLSYLAFSAVAIAVFTRVRGVASPAWRRARDANTELYGDAQEWFDGLPDIRANGAEGYVGRRFAVGLRRLFHRSRAATALSLGVSHVSQMILLLGATAVLALAAILYRSGGLEIGIVVALLMYTRIINRPLEDIVDEMADLQRSTASIARIEDLLATTPTVASGPGVTPASGPLAVTFEDVTFAYPGAGGPALTDVSFALEPGEVLGVVGRTGSGKTTLGRLLLRLYDPTRGRITLNGQDLREATLDQIRHQVGVVGQDVHLFHASLRDNLTLFASGVADEQLVGVLRDVGLAGWYARLDDGLDSALPDAGLSAGEAQLLGVARILLTDPGVVILDEPTSRLDPDSEARLRRALDRLLRGRTGVIIAHRLTTLERADTVLVVDGGRVVEHGPRPALAADPGSAYHRALSLARDGSGVAPVGGAR